MIFVELSLKAIELTSRLDSNPAKLLADIVDDWSGRVLFSDAANGAYVGLYADILKGLVRL